MIDTKAYAEHNRKMQRAKDAAADARARKKIAEENLTGYCAQLTELLGKKVTPDNIRDVAADFEAEAAEIMRRNDALLAGAEDGDDDSDYDAAPVASGAKTAATKAAGKGVKSAESLFDDDDF